MTSSPFSLQRNPTHTQRLPVRSASGRAVNAHTGQARRPGGRRSARHEGSAQSCHPLQDSGGSSLRWLLPEPRGATAARRPGRQAGARRGAGKAMGAGMRIQDGCARAQAERAWRYPMDGLRAPACGGSRVGRDARSGPELGAGGRKSGTNPGCGGVDRRTAAAEWATASHPCVAPRGRVGRASRRVCALVTHTVFSKGAVRLAGLVCVRRSSKNSFIHSFEDTVRGSIEDKA